MGCFRVLIVHASNIQEKVKKLQKDLQMANISFKMFHNGTKNAERNFQCELDNTDALIVCFSRSSLSNAGQKFYPIAQKILEQYGRADLSYLERIALYLVKFSECETPSLKFQLGEKPYDFFDLRLANCFDFSIKQHNKDTITKLKTKLYWRQYYKSLSEFIGSDRSDMILQADIEYKNRQDSSSENRAAFKLQSGQKVREFITIWEMFDHSVEFNDCMDKLAEIAHVVHEQTRYSRIVTATTSAKELSSHIFERLIKDHGNKEVQITHFGDYPTTPLSHIQPMQFKNEKILILTDIISTGSLIRNMAETVIKNGGKIAAVVGIVMTKKEWIRKQNVSNNPVTINFGSKEPYIYNLSDYIVDPVKENQYDESKLIPVDYSNILPDHYPPYPQKYRPKFSLQKMFNHFEKAKAIDISFFEFQDRHYSCAFHLEHIIRKSKNNVWDKIKKILRIEHKKSTNKMIYLLTTFSKSDLNFAHYIQTNLKREGINSSIVITLKSGITDTAYLHLTLGAKGSRLQGQEVNLVLATISRTVKLRNIVSLLLEQNVRKITVICLLNRMGLNTTKFIGDIERFARRVSVPNLQRSTHNHTFTKFEFHMLYSFLDISNNDIIGMHKTINWLLTNFQQKTKVPAFRRLIQQMRNFFLPKTVFEPIKYSIAFKLPAPFALSINNKKIKTTTAEGKIALMIYNLALNRDFKPILKEIVSINDSSDFSHLLGLIISDIHHLQFTHKLVELKNDITKEIENIRVKRYHIENKFNTIVKRKNLFLEIDDLIMREALLIFTLGILTYHETKANLETLEESITDLIFYDNDDVKNIIEHPLNSLRYLGNEQIFCNFSFLLHGLFPEFSKEGNDTQVKNQIKEKINDIIVNINNYYEDIRVDVSNEKKRTLINSIRTNFEMLLTEIGSIDSLKKYQIIKYLHREIYRPKEGHNPIFSSMLPLLTSFRNTTTLNRDRSDSYRFEAKHKTLIKIDDALTGTAALHTIEQYIRQLFHFTPSIHADQYRYLASSEQDGSFAADVNILRRTLNHLRQSRSFSRSDFCTIRAIYRRMNNDFLQNTSKLRSALNGYIVSLGDLIETSLEEANTRLNDYFGEEHLNLLHDVHPFKGITEKKKIAVLVDYNLLRETLRNIFYNIRYSFSKDSIKKLPENPILLKVREEKYIREPENREQDGITIILEVKGNPPSTDDLENPTNTLADQLYKIREFGGSWKLVVSDKPVAYTLQLMLISRRGFIK